MAVTYNRYSYEFVTVSLLKRLRNGGFTSETAARHMDPEVRLKKSGQGHLL
jgi:hypothetical protein